MIRKAGAGVTFSHTLDEEVVKIKALVDATERQADAILEAIGIQVLSWIHQDYRTKARGGTDPGGTKWDDITEDTVRGRLRRLASYRNASDVVQTALVEAAVASHEIGVDTGRLVNSLEYGRGGPDTLFDLDAYSASIGTVVQYAPYYDAARPIILERQITPDRLRELEEIVEEIMQMEIEEKMR